MKTILFQKISYVEYEHKKENIQIEKIKKGGKYIVIPTDTYPNNDADGFEGAAIRCVAQKDRWRIRTNGNVFTEICDIIYQYGGTIVYDESKETFFDMPYCIVHMLDGTELKKMFDDDAELDNYVKDLFVSSENVKVF